MKINEQKWIDRDIKTHLFDLEFSNFQIVIYLFGKDGNVLVERLGWADVSTGHARLTWRTRRQFAFFENERQQREKRMPITNQNDNHNHKYRSSLCWYNILYMLNDPSSISKKKQTKNKKQKNLFKNTNIVLISRDLCRRYFGFFWSQFHVVLCVCVCVLWWMTA